MSGAHELEPSEEVDERHLELAREVGEGYQRAARHMIDDVAATGDTTERGDYVIGFAQEAAEGLYQFVDGDLEWHDPAEGDNCHLEVVVAEAATGRFLPAVDVRATLTSEAGDSVGPLQIPFVWHPGLLHYGRNLELPGDGAYTIEIELEPPDFPRHDERNGGRFTDPVTVRFEDIEIETGRS